MTARKGDHRLSKARKERHAKPEPSVLKTTLNDGETKNGRMAEFMVEGLAMNAMLGLVFSSKLGELDLTECFAQMLSRAREVANRETKSQETILAGQVISLNALYTDLAVIARQNISNAAIFERLMRLALKAQSNCRATVEALATIQNPPAVFARQANFAAGPQQINNGTAARPIARASDSKSEPNKLLEADGDRLDAGATIKAVTGDHELATVGAINGTKDGRR